MKIEIHRTEDSLDITLQYGSTSIDHIALGVTIAGAAIYLFILLRRFSFSGEKLKEHYFDSLVEF